jgi:hypothetical protein
MIRERSKDLFSESTDYTMGYNLANHTTLTGEIIDFGQEENFAVPPHSIKIWIKTAATGAATTDTLKLTISSSTDGSSFDTLFVTKAFPISELTEGKVLVDMAVPKNCHRYLQVTGTESVSFTGGVICGTVRPDFV